VAPNDVGAAAALPLGGGASGAPIRTRRAVIGGFGVAGAGGRTGVVAGVLGAAPGVAITRNAR